MTGPTPSDPAPPDQIAGSTSDLSVPQSAPPGVPAPDLPRGDVPRPDVPRGDLTRPDLPPYVPTQPPTRSTVPRSRIGNLWVASVLFALVLLLLLIFVLENGQRAEVSFFGAHGHLPMGVALLFAAVFGILLVALPGTGRIIQLRILNRRRARSAARDGASAHDAVAPGSFQPATGQPEPTQPPTGAPATAQPSSGSPPGRRWRANPRSRR